MQLLSERFILYFSGDFKSSHLELLFVSIKDRKKSIVGDREAKVGAILHSRYPSAL